MTDSTIPRTRLQETPMQPASRKPPPTLRSWPLGLPLLRAIRRDPLGMMERLHATQGDVAHLKVLSTDLYYLFRPETVRRVLVDHQADFVKEERILRIFRSVQGANVITTEGPAWERQRRILTPAFSLKRMAACAGLMAAAADENIRQALPTAPGERALVNVDRLTTRITMDVILRALFGYQAGRDEADAVSGAVRGLSRQVMREFFWPLSPVAGLPYPGRAEKRRHLAVLRELIQTQIRKRREAAPIAGEADDVPDMLALMFAARDDQAAPWHAALSDREIHDNCVGLFGAGHDTSATALTWWIGLMATHPGWVERVREETSGPAWEQIPDRHDLAGARCLTATLKEAMRLYPPSTATFSRRAVRDVTVDDVTLPRHALVVVPIWSMHRDPRWFPEPGTFDPGRFLPGAAAIPRGAFMPFGAGPHVCLGQQFAMVEMAIIAARLLRRFDLSLPAGSVLPAPVVDLVLKPSTPLNVCFKRR